jgi:hypothetical protein
MNDCDTYFIFRENQAQLQGLDFNSNDIILHKKYDITYTTRDISGYTINIGLIDIDLYENEYIKFDENCIFVLIYIPLLKSNIADTILKNTCFQLFTSEELDSKKKMVYPFNYYDGYMKLLKFDALESFDSIVIKTIEYIKYNIKEENTNYLISTQKVLETLNFDLDGERHYDFYDKYYNIDIEESIEYYTNTIQLQQQLLLDCEKQFTFTLDNELNLVSYCAMEIDNSFVDVLLIRNIDLEKKIKDKNHERICDWIANVKLFLDTLQIPDIDINDTYNNNDERISTLQYDCNGHIEYYEHYVKEYIKDYKDYKDYNEDLDIHESNELITLLESKKVLIEEKIAELESMSAILLENERRNTKIVSLTNKIKELLEEEHDINDYKVFKFQYISKYYVGYKHMIKIIQNENINELLDKIPLLEAKQKEEEETEKEKEKEMKRKSY